MDWLPMDRRAEITHEQLDKILDIFLVRVNLRARFPRGPRHCLSELTARLAALVLADTAQHGIRRSGRRPPLRRASKRSSTSCSSCRRIAASITTSEPTPAPKAYPPASASPTRQAVPAPPPPTTPNSSTRAEPTIGPTR